MIFEVYGGFALPKSFRNKVSLDDKVRHKFWDEVARKRSNLSEACGCYVFAMQYGDNIRAWYVGKTEKQSFKKECFQLSKKKLFIMKL